MSLNGAPVMAASVVAVDVGKTTAALSVTDAARHRLLGPVQFTMTAPAVAAVLEQVCAVLPSTPVKVGVEAAGHYHRPLLSAAVWPLLIGNGPCVGRRVRPLRVGAQSRLRKHLGSALRGQPVVLRDELISRGTDALSLGRPASRTAAPTRRSLPPPGPRARQLRPQHQGYPLVGSERGSPWLVASNLREIRRAGRAHPLSTQAAAAKHHQPAPARSPPLWL
jgi:hypothetical protein